MPRALLRVLWAVAVYAAITAGALASVNRYARFVLPFYRWELGLIAPEYQVEELDLDIARGQPAFHVKATNRDALSAIDRSFPPRSLVFEFQFFVMQGLGHAVMLFFVPLAWPGFTWMRKAKALVWAIPIQCLLESADAPWALVGGLDAVKNQFVHAPDSLPMIWLHIASSGGSFAIGLAGGVLACLLPAIVETPGPRKLRRGAGRGAAARKRVRM